MKSLEKNQAADRPHRFLHGQQRLCRQRTRRDTGRPKSVGLRNRCERPHPRRNRRNRRRRPSRLRRGGVHARTGGVTPPPESRRRKPFPHHGVGRIATLSGDFSETAIVPKNKRVFFIASENYVKLLGEFYHGQIPSFPNSDILTCLAVKYFIAG